jgi:hypothetical protein
MFEGFQMTEAQLYVGDLAYPLASDGNYTVAPGLYPYSAGDLSGESSFQFGPLDVSNYTKGIHVIAHAVTCEDTSDVTSFKDYIGLDAYPVPFDKEVNLKYSTSFGTDIKIEIFNMTGSLLRSYQINDHIENVEGILKVDLSHTANQMFLVRMTTNKGVIVKKIVSSSLRRH